MGLPDASPTAHPRRHITAFGCRRSPPRRERRADRGAHAAATAQRLCARAGGDCRGPTPTRRRARPLMPPPAHRARTRTPREAGSEPNDSASGRDKSDAGDSDGRPVIMIMRRAHRRGGGWGSRGASRRGCWRRRAGGRAGGPGKRGRRAELERRRRRGGRRWRCCSF